MLELDSRYDNVKDHELSRNPVLQTCSYRLILIMNSLKNIIRRCHQQQEKSLRQRKTIVKPALYKNYPYHFTVHCARGHAIRVHELEQAEISFMPIGHAPDYDHAPKDFGGDRFLKRQRTRDWTPRRWYASWGIQVYTGTPSGRDGAHWHDIYFKYDAICTAPDAVFNCIEALMNSVAKPLLTLTKSGGLRFSCRVLNYLHPNTDEAKQYIQKHVPTSEDPEHRDVLLKIFGEAGYSRWDARYEILSGDLLAPPTITKDVLFAPINLLRDALHESALSSNQPSTVNTSDDIEVRPPFPGIGLPPTDEKILAIRENKLSPLAIKRPSPVLRKSVHKDSSQEIRTLHVIEHDEKTGWLSAIKASGAYLHFSETSISKDILDAWKINWQETALGNFAKALLNALESGSELYENPVRRVHMAIQAFQEQEETLIQQMNEEEPNQTLWHQLKHFFQHYQRNADAPMVWDDNILRFWLPSTLDTAKVLPNKVKNGNSKPWLAGNRVFQIRTSIYSLHEILNYENNWDELELSEIMQHFLRGILAEIERDPNIQHVLVSNQRVSEQIGNIASKENVNCISHIKRAINAEGIGKAFESADVIWIVGAPYWPPHLIWKQAQILFGNDTEPLSYDVKFTPYGYKDERIQNLYEQNIVGILTHLIGRAGLDCFSNKTVVLLTGIPLPGITDRPETLLFDWEDFEIAGRLDKLAETITIRERFEEERANLTVESGREKVEQVLGVSRSQANRILMKLRGGKRPTMQEQIHTLLSDGEKKTAELVSVIEGHPNAVKNELKRLVEMGEIVKVRRAVYALPPRIETEDTFRKK